MSRPDREWNKWLLWVHPLSHVARAKAPAEWFYLMMAQGNGIAAAATRVERMKWVGGFAPSGCKCIQSAAACSAA